MIDASSSPDPNAVLTGAMQALVDRDAATALALTAWLVDACPDSPQAHYVRAAALSQQHPAQAHEALELARLVHAMALMQSEGIDVSRLANDGPYAVAITRKFYNRFWMGPAIIAAGCAMSHPAVAVDAMILLAQALQYQGRAEEAARLFLAALRDKPAAEVHSFALYSLMFVKDGVRRQAEEARRWQSRWAQPFTPNQPSFNVSRAADRRLKLAYVTPTFSHNALRHFLAPLLDQHDRSKFDVWIYVADAAKETPRDDLTIKSYSGMSYLDHAAMIRSDGIDILVDIHGHAAKGRAMAFAAKPAPVQVSWLNWNQTTGLSAMDYVIHADAMVAAEEHALFSEKVWEVGPILAPFRPDASARPSPTPALTKGHVTFGAFHHPAKISDETIAAFARILRAVPGARLHFKYSCYADPVLQMETMVRLMAHGVAAESLEFSGHETGEAYEAAFRGIDVHLDSNPVCGGTTTMEALSRGVPVLTLSGDDYYARIGVHGLMALGLPQLVAESWDDYVAKAVAMASDIPALAALRARVRPALDASLYRDEAAFTRQMETAYEGMFSAWLAKDLATAA